MCLLWETCIPHIAYTGNLSDHMKHPILRSFHVMWKIPHLRPKRNLAFFVPFSSSSDLSATQWIYSWPKTLMGFQYLPKLFSRMCVLCNHRQPSLFLLLSSKHCITHGQKARKFRWFVWEERKPPVYTADQILPCIFMHLVGYISGGVWARVPAGGVSATNRVPKAGAPGCAQGAAPGYITQNPGNGPSFLLSGATQPTNVLFW